MIKTKNDKATQPLPMASLFDLGLSVGLEWQIFKFVDLTPHCVVKLRGFLEIQKGDRPQKGDSARKGEVMSSYEGENFWPIYNI